MARGEEFVVSIDLDDASVAFIYSDELADIAAEGDSRTCRVSDVEPAPEGGWQADMAKSNGPVLGPFALRGDALKAEVSYVKRQVLGG